MTGLRIGVYSDLEFWRRDGEIVAEESFLLFVGALRDHAGSLVVAGRMDDGDARGSYRVRDDAEFVALPHYPALTRPLATARAVRGSLRVFRSLLGRVDAVWLLG